MVDTVAASMAAWMASGRLGRGDSVDSFGSLKDSGCPTDHLDELHGGPDPVSAAAVSPEARQARAAPQLTPRSRLAGTPPSPTSAWSGLEPRDRTRSDSGGAYVGPSRSLSVDRSTDGRSAPALRRRSWSHPACSQPSSTRGSIIYPCRRNVRASDPPRPPRATSGLHMPQTSIRLPSNSSVRRNTFSLHGFVLRSKTTRWPASAPHRSM